MVKQFQIEVRPDTPHWAADYILVFRSAYGKRQRTAPRRGLVCDGTIGSDSLQGLCGSLSQKLSHRLRRNPVVPVYRNALQFSGGNELIDGAPSHTQKGGSLRRRQNIRVFLLFHLSPPLDESLFWCYDVIDKYHFFNYSYTY